jgi:hypothetical protein
MKQALEALKPYARQIVDQGKDYEMVKCDPKVDTAITSLRTAIAEAEKSNIKQVIHLYDKPPVAPVQESESFEQWNAKQHGDPEEIGLLQALRIAYCAGQDSVSKATPPAAQRQWVGFTDEEINEYDYEHRDFIYDIEALLKHKNTRLG